jgi:hypothetical protein
MKFPVIFPVSREFATGAFLFGREKQRSRKSRRTGKEECPLRCLTSCKCAIDRRRLGGRRRLCPFDLLRLRSGVPWRPHTPIAMVRWRNRRDTKLHVLWAVR